MKKRFLSLFLIVSMISSMTSVFAALSSPFETELEGKPILQNVTEDEDLPLMSLEYLDENGQPAEIPSSGLQTDDVFFLGLKVTNFDKYIGMVNNGLKSMTVSIAYNFEYVTPQELNGSSKVAPSNMGTYLPLVKSRLQTNPNSYINTMAMNTDDEELSLYDLVGTYADLSDAQIPSGVLKGEYRGSGQADRIKKLQFSITANENGLADGELKKGAILNDYIAIMRVVVKAVPENPSKIMAICTDGENMAFSLADNTELGYGNASTPWHHFLRLDNSGGNIFPAEYTLEYYNDNTQVTKVYTETISETSLQAAKMSEAQAEAEKVKPNESDYFMGWKVPDNDGDNTNDVAFEGDISALLPDDPATPIKVYADWKTGYPVNFYAEKEDIGDDAKKLETKYVKPDGSSTLGTINLPDNPTKTDYGFNKWLCEDDSDFKADTTVIPEGGLNVYADWTEMLTINYDTNGSSDTIEKSTDAPDATYTLPTDPTRNGYTFVGWNTKKNGAGDYISVTSTTTYQDISNMLDTTKTMYAQWADVKDPTTDPGKIKNEPEQPADPDDDGVRVKFDSNGKKDPTDITKEAKPLYKYPKVGETIDAANMPDPPERTNYVFQGWNTKANGSGTLFTTETGITITNDMLPTGDGAEREVVLYAQWGVDNSNTNKIKVKFDKNTTATTGVADANPLTREVIADDPLINLPEPPVNGTFVFGGWNTAADGSGTSVDATTPITENMATVDAEGKKVTLYAQWSKLINLKMEYQDDSGQKADPVYDGTPKTPKIIEIWEADEGGNDLRQVTDPTEIQYYKDNITIKYQLVVEDQPVGDSTNSPTNAGEYEYDITLTAELTDKNIEVQNVTPTGYSIAPMKLDFAISGQQARYAGTAGAAPATITVTTTDIPSDFNFDNDVKATYKQLELPDGDRVIESGKFGTFSVENPAATDFNSTDRIGKYVIELSIDNPNYIVGDIPVNARYPEIDDGVNIYYPGSSSATSIKYEIIPNDPKATGLAVTKAGEDRATQALTLTDSDYETTKAFTSDDEATTDEAKKNHYWVTVDKDTDAVDIYVDAETYYTVKINGDSEDTLTNGTAKDTVSNLKKTIETDENGVITKTDVDNVIPIKVESAGSDPKEYTIHVRRLADAQATDLKFTEKDNPDNIFGLKDNTYETDKEFKPGDTEYWVRVPKDKDTVDVLVSALGQGDKKITINGTQVTPDTNGVAKANITDLKQAVEKNDDGTLKRDENNQVIVNTPKDITVVIGEGADAKTYTIHVQRLGEGGIDLNPGNSPYGMIERMRAKYYGATGAWTNEQIEAVKAKLFDHSADTPTTARYKFRNTLDVNGVTMNALPDGADTSIFYQPMAWGSGALKEPSYDPNVNMDMNDNALFIYQKKPFKDPGFTAYDEAGQAIDLEAEGVTVTRVVKDVKKMLVINMLELDESQCGDVTLETDPNDGLVHNLTYFTTGSKLIRPDIYDLEYTISRPDKEDIKITRKIILLARRGDVNLDDDINSNDGTRVRNHYQGIQDVVPTGLDSRIAKLYNYKIADVNLDGDISSNDETRIRNHYQGIESMAREIYINN